MNIRILYVGPFPKLTIQLKNGKTATVEKGKSVEVDKATADELLSVNPREWKNSAPDTETKTKKSKKD